MTEGHRALLRVLPAVLVLAVTALVLRFYAVPLATTGLFGLYITVGVLIPGTLLWRAARTGGDCLVADVAAGAATGYACETFVYMFARALGVPHLVLVWPVAVMVIFTGIPRLRRYWRSGGASAQRPPTIWVWGLAGMVLLVLSWSVKFYRTHGLEWPSYANPNIDVMFHLALLGEAKHHIPMTTPWVAGEPLYYHWFVYAEMAATSWATGIEPQLLLLRLSPLPMVAALVALVAILALRLFHRWWIGLLAVVMTFLVLAPHPYGWSLHPYFLGYGFDGVDDGSLLRLSMWTSPTQTFGALLCAPVVLLLVDLLRGCQRPAGRWVLLGLLACALMGAKATFLPLVLAGLLTVLIGGALVRLIGRWPHRAVGGSLWTEALAAAMIAVVMLFAIVVVFDGRDQGLAWRPLTALRSSGLAGTTAFGLDGKLWQLALLSVVTVWCWCAMAGGIAGLLWRPPGDEKPLLLLLGMGGTGWMGTALLGQSGDSQRFFVESARPYLGVLAAGGLACVAGSAGALPHRTARWLGATGLAGIVTIVGVRGLDGPTTPTVWPVGPKHVALALAWPHAVVIMAAGVLGGVVWLRHRRFGPPLAAMVAFWLGCGLVTAGDTYRQLVHDAASHGWHDAVEHAGESAGSVPRGTREAGRWLREHSDPNDLVATNAHCSSREKQSCVNLRFAFAAYSERRMLVEGWGFTSKAHMIANTRGLWVGFVPFWDQRELDDNDAAFTDPSEDRIQVLSTHYGVRWLFVDETLMPPGSRLSAYAVRRFRSGDCAIFEIAHPKR